jgi:hypothetical protein
VDREVQIHPEDHGAGADKAAVVLSASRSISPWPVTPLADSSGSGTGTRPPGPAVVLTHSAVH